MERDGDWYVRFASSLPEALRGLRRCQMVLHVWSLWVAFSANGDALGRRGRSLLGT
jgi:hypothetical protein